MSEPTQEALFDKGEWWQEHYKGMPAFEQKNLMPYKTIFVHFETRSDMDAFAELVGQKIALSTPSIWYPEADIEHWTKHWVDAPPEQPDEDVEVIEG